MGNYPQNVASEMENPLDDVKCRFGLIEQRLNEGIDDFAPEEIEEIKKKLKEEAKEMMKDQAAMMGGMPGMPGMAPPPGAGGPPPGAGTPPPEGQEPAENTPPTQVETVNIGELETLLLENDGSKELLGVIKSLKYNQKNFNKKPKEKQSK